MNVLLLVSGRSTRADHYAAVFVGFQESRLPKQGFAFNQAALAKKLREFTYCISAWNSSHRLEVVPAHLPRLVIAVFTLVNK